MKLSENLPQPVLHLCWSHDAWIIGSAATLLVGNSDTTPRDIDVLVPFREWPRAASTIPRGTPANSFGGFKLPTTYKDGTPVDVDIWPGDLGDLILRSNDLIRAYQPARNRLVYVSDPTHTISIPSVFSRPNLFPDG